MKATTWLAVPARQLTKTVSGPALFANDTMALLPAAALAVGHGAANLGGSGSSGDNRQVVVVIEEPA